MRNALCHGGGQCATPCVTEGGACAQRLVSHNALCRPTPCVAEGAPVHNALCHRGGACAQRLVSHNAVCRATPWEHLGIHSVSPPAKKSKTGRPRTTNMSSSFRSHPPTTSVGVMHIHSLVDFFTFQWLFFSL